MKTTRSTLRPVRGFTLTELMVVVVIMGILATLGVASLRGYLFKAKSVEGLSVIRAIAAAQERFRGENLVYLSVSDDLTTYYPMAVGEMGSTRYQWNRSSGSNYANWQRLAPTVNTPVQFGYATVAGLPGQNFPTTSLSTQPVWPTNPSQPWYVIQATGDVNEDGVFEVLVTSSFSDQVARQEIAP